MDKSFHSQNWYRVAGLKPRLRRHARLYRNHYRGELWYVLQDRTSGRFHRFSPSSYMLISMMDGKRTVQEIWEIACERVDDESLTQDELIQLLGQLHAADVLYGDLPPDIGEIAERGRKQHNKKFLMSFMNPLAVRLPVFDPDDFVSATLPLVRPFISWFGALIWLGVVGYGIFLALSHWPELTDNVFDRVLTGQNFGILVLCYITIKAVHELGHAYVVKRWGGDVHEIGIMFLVFMPVPYVDASDAMRFNNKWQRALVGGAGILVEGFLAALAMIVWVNAEDGFLRAFAFNTMLIGGISTVLFNGNPLLKFDGYYVLSDLIEIPNLAQRSKTYIGYLIKRYAFGMKHERSPATALGEPGWFVSYGVASFVYRVFVTLAIVLFVSTQFFFLGIILAIWAVVLMLGWPLLKMIWFLLANPGLRRHRGRAFAVTGGAVAAIAAVLFAVPVPHATVTEGVVWVSGEQIVHSEGDGVVVGVAAHPGQEIMPGTPLVRLDNPLIAARAQLLDGYIEELERRLAAQTFADRSAARVLSEELNAARADRTVTEGRLENLVVRADTEGELIMPRADDLVGRFVRRGDVCNGLPRSADPGYRFRVAQRPRAQRNTGCTGAIRLRSGPDRARADRTRGARPQRAPAQPCAGHQWRRARGAGPERAGPKYGLDQPPASRRPYQRRHHI